MKLLSYFPPILISILTVTTLYQANATRLEWQQIWMPLGMGLIIALFFSFIFWLNPLTNKKWPFIASVFTLAALLFYEIHPITAGVLMVGSMILTWKLKSFGDISFVVSCIAIAGIILSSGHASYLNGKYEPTGPVTTIATTDKQYPNIYFIVTDRCPNIDGMRELGINPDSFVSNMLNMGFYIKNNQMSHDPYTVNYDGPTLETTRTMRYFASALNGGIDIPLNSKYQDTRNLIKQPSLFDYLHSKGYTIVNIASWFAETKDILTADVTCKYLDITLMERIFESELSVTYWNRTILRGINFRFMQSDASMGSVERGRATWQSDELKAWSQAVHGQSLFIMAHLLMPHEPFVFNAAGGSADNKLSQPEQYEQQIIYTMDYLQNVAEWITASDPTAIIIIQSDEGMAYKKPIELNYALSPTQWNGVLTCWRIPDKNGLELSSLKHTEILQTVINNLK